MRTVYLSDVYCLEKIQRITKKFSVIDLNVSICGDQTNNAVNYLKQSILTKEIKKTLNNKKVSDCVMFLYQTHPMKVIQHIKNITEEDINFVLISSIENVFEYYKELPREVIIIEN